MVTLPLYENEAKFNFVAFKHVPQHKFVVSTVSELISLEAIILKFIVVRYFNPEWISVEIHT